MRVTILGVIWIEMPWLKVNNDDYDEVAFSSSTLYADTRDAALAMTIETLEQNVAELRLHENFEVSLR